MKKLTWLQPVLFAIFPILALFSRNLKIMQPREILAPMAIVIGATGLLLLLAFALLRDREGAAAIVSVFWLLFFSYAHVLRAIGGAGDGRDKCVLGAWLVLFGATSHGIVRRRGRLQNLASILTVVGVALVAMPLVSIAPALLPVGRARMEATAYQAPLELPEPTPRGEAPTPEPNHLATARTPSPGAAPTGTQPAAPPTASPPAQLPAEAPERPSIYYIILDGYARADVLEDLYGYDNSDFISALAERGFYVAGASRANYCQTYLSLGSSLSSTYLDELSERMGETSDDRGPLRDLLRHNRVAALLKEEGYTYVTFSTGYAEGELDSADVHRTAPRSLTQFQSELVGTAPISPVIKYQYDMHRERLLYAFQHVPDVAEMEQPVFLLAHITCPHPPFVFDELGQPVTPNSEFNFADGSHYIGSSGREAYVQGYVRQLRYVNGKVLALVDEILARSLEPPVIILQSDHGPGSHLDWGSVENTDLRERLSILNAYYLPGGAQAHLYETITPVNTFRIIFNHYLGTNYALLSDKSYFSIWHEPYRFHPVPQD